MSMEISVAFHGKLPSKDALTRAMQELGFPLSIVPNGTLDEQEGFMPMRLWDEESGCEFDVFDGRDTIEEIAGDEIGEIDPRFDRSANFRWGGNESEMVAAVCSAAALARIVDGVVLGDMEDQLLSADEAIASARGTLEYVQQRRAQGA